MPNLFSAKNEPPVESQADGPDSSPAGAASNSGELPGLIERFAKLGRLLDQTNDSMTAYLLRRESQAVASGEQGGAVALFERIETLAKKLDQLSEAIPPQAAPVDDAVVSALGRLSDAIAEQREAVAGSLHELRRRVDDGLAELTKRLWPVQEAKQEAEADVPATSDDWLHAILGAMLAKDPSLDSQRRQFVQDILSDHVGACSLAGQLLVFQSTSPEKMPTLLKDIGEAYYRWQPKRSAGNRPMEEALAAWLQRACDNAGISNSIALVHPGERFDATRHTASGRGVEITEVFGWIVLRDNGKVYTKAGVAIK